MGGGVIVVLLALYFIPALVAYNRGHHNQNAIFVLNLFLGWTFIFWVISLVWACTAVNEPEPKKLGGILGRIEQQKAARERENERVRQYHESQREKAKWAALSSEPPLPKVVQPKASHDPVPYIALGVAGLIFGIVELGFIIPDKQQPTATTTSPPASTMPQSTVLEGLTSEAPDSFRVRGFSLQTKKLDDLMPVASDGQVGSIPRRSEEATATAPVATPLATAPLATAPLATAPVATPAVTAPVAGIKIATVAPYVIQVGIKHNQTEALGVFADLQHRYASLLADYRPMVQKVDLGSKGVWYRLRIGPIRDKVEGTRLCMALKSKGWPNCLVMAAQ
jgi:hypothetical protein